MPPRNECGSSCNFGVVSGERIFWTSSGSTRLHGQFSSHTEEIREELGEVKDQLRTPEERVGKLEEEPHRAPLPTGPSQQIKGRL